VKRTVSALAALLLGGVAVPTFAGTATGTLTVNIGAATRSGSNSGGTTTTAPQNTIAVSLDPSQTAAVTNYPLQFGRPFLDGAVPSGDQAVVVYQPAGSSTLETLPTQMDVKNRYKDGSVEYAVMAAVLPSIAPGSTPSMISFGTAPVTSSSNTPLTAAQMEGSNFNFDAAMSLSGTANATAATRAVLTGGQTDQTCPTGTQTDCWATSRAPGPFLTTVTNGGFDITIDGVLTHVTGINFSNLTSSWGNFDQDIAAALPSSVTLGTNGPVLTLTTTATGANATITAASAPTTGATDLSSVLGLLAADSATTVQGKAAVAGQPFSGSADALKMLQAGNYQLWTSGPVAQTIELADDSPTHAYDIGFGDGFTPVRPRFIATFWPATNQVFVRAIGENDLTTELEDTPPYNLTVTGGASSPATEDTVSNLITPALTLWNARFWLGGTPNPEVNVNYNLAYLESTRFVPNYDTSVQLSQATIASDYAKWWTNTDNSPINGIGPWQPLMGTTGARPDIGPEPSWDVAWLYSGDWRMAQVALGAADLADQWSVNTRETDPNAILNRTNSPSASGQVGTGYGRPISITYRTTLGPSNGGEPDFLNYNSDQSNPPNKLIQVGNISMNCNASCQNANNWQFDAAHEPSPFFIPYVLTGDPFYLHELEEWAAYDATEMQGDCVSNLCRGPTGDEGAMDDQERGDAWSIRSRAEETFAIPDSDPFKTYLTILMNEDLAFWEGANLVTDPVLGSYAEYAYGKQVGNPESAVGAGQASPIGQWEANNTAQVVQGLIGAAEVNKNVGAFNDPWMEAYIGYALGRAQELGFNAGPLLGFVGEYETGLINSTGNPELIGNYEDPSATSANAWIASWSAYVATFETPFLTGNGYAGGSAQGSIPQQFGAPGAPAGGEGELYAQGYDAYHLAAVGMLVNAGVSGAPQAYSWMQTNVYQPILTSGNGDPFTVDPSWDILPRTDKNVLSAQPTTPQ
jgi:uncharacterized protein DUF3383